MRSPRAAQCHQTVPANTKLAIHSRTFNPHLGRWRDARHGTE